MHKFFYSIFGLFLSPGGILVLAGLDASMLFFMPAAIDTAVILMTARRPELFWAFPFLATAGSVIGAAITFQIGTMIGEKGLTRWIPEKRLNRVRKNIGQRGAYALGLAALMPPPFPLTPFVLTGGALQLDRRKVLGSLGAMRLLRFGTLSLLALRYGTAIVGWLESDAFQAVIAGLMVIGILGTAVTVHQVYRRAR